MVVQRRLSIYYLVIERSACWNDGRFEGTDFVSSVWNYTVFSLCEKNYLPRIFN